MSNLTPREKRQTINLGNKISEIEKLQKASHIAPRLPYSSVPEGNLVITDSEGNVVDVVGPKGNPESGDQLVLPGREPSKPSIPLVSAYLGTITATWDGTYTEDYVAPDLLQIEVHSSTDDDFEASAGTLIGTINGQRGGSVTLAVEYGTHYVRFVAVSTSGSRSVESDIASVEVTPLVETIEMTEVLDDIDQRFGGVITEAQQLNDKLAQAETDIDNAQADLTNLETVRLPAVEANIEAAHQEIVSTGNELGTRLTQAETDIATAESGLNTIKNTDLPALNQRLSNAETEITTTGQQLDSRLDDAFIQIGTVDSKTQANATAASNAQSAADAANSAASVAAGIANGKGKVLVQSTAPGAEDRNAVTLWIDTTGGANTPKRWTSGTTWVAVTDKVAVDAAQAAVNAQSRADAAHTAAGNAQTTANNALTMAGSKNSVFYSANAPSGTANTGDTWRQVNAKGDVIAEWRWTAGGSWLSQQVTTEMISNLDVGKLTAGTANISDLVVEKLWAEVIRAKKITADQLLVGSGTNLIVDPYLEDATVKAARATASSLAGGYGRNSTTNLNWYGGTQPTGSVQTYYFSATSSRTDTSAMIPIVEGSKYRFKFLYNSISGGARPVASIVRKDGTTGVTASGFTTNGVATSGFGGAGSGQTMEAVWTPDPSWNYAYFVPGIQWESTVTSAHIYGGASVQDMTDGSLIVNGSIDADKINTNSIVAEVAKFIKLDVSSLIASNATINTAVIEKLWTDVIRSRKITTDQLLVGQGENLISWDMVSTLDSARANISGYGSGSVQPTLQKGAGVSDGDHMFMVADWVNPGSNTITWQLSNGGSAGGLSSRWTVEPEEELVFSAYVRAGGSYSGSMPGMRVAMYWYNAAGSNISNVSSPATPLTWSWQKLTIDGKAPATAAYALVYIRQDQPGGVRVDLPSLYRKKGASLIVDGAIEAKHITASESLSSKVGQFLKLDVKDLISTGTAKLNDAVIDKLWTDVVHSKKITSDMVVIGGTNNLIPNANVLTDLAGWEDNSVSTLKRTVGTSFPYMYATTQGNVRSAVFEVIGGGRYRFRIKAQAAATGSRFYVQVNTNGASNPYPIAGQTLTTGWVDYTGEVDLPSDATTGYINIYVNHSSGIVTTQRFANLSLIQMSSGELIVDGAITATKIATNAIEADKIKANAITADKIDVGAIKAQHISSKEITADKLRIGQGSNVFPDPLIQDAAGWPSSNTTVYTGGYGSSNRVRITAGTGQTGGYYGNGSDDLRRFPVIPGRSYVVSVWVRPTVNISANSVIAVFNRLVKETGTGFVFTSPSAVYNSLETTGVSTIPANTWVKMEGKISVPSDATNTFLIPGLYLQSGFPTGSSCDFSNLNISEAVTGELIVEGSITADKIKSGAITADKLDSGAITGKTITGGTITGAEIVGSRYQFNGAGAGNGYNLRIENDTLGAYLGFSVPNGINQGTIRAFDEDPWADYSTPTLVIRPPSVSGKADRDAVKISAGIDGGTGGLMDVGGNLWVRGEIRGRYQDANDIGRWTSLAINDVTSNYTGESPTIKSLGMYNRVYTYASNMYITSNGYIGRTTSLRDTKLVIEDIPRDQIDALLNVPARWWFDKGDSERLAAYLSKIEAGEDPSVLGDVPEDLTRIPGLVAEEVEASGATAFVTYDRDEFGNKKLSGVNYDRIGPALIPLVREQRDEIADLKSRLALLEAKVDSFHPPQV